MGLNLEGLSFFTKVQISSNDQGGENDLMLPSKFGTIIMIGLGYYYNFISSQMNE
jgi:hypothetical protein